MVLKNRGKYLCYYCCITLSSSRKTNTSSRRSSPPESCAPWTDMRHARLHSVEGWISKRRRLQMPGQEEQSGAYPTAGAARKGTSDRGHEKQIAANDLPKLPPKLPRHLSGEATWLPPSCYSRSLSSRLLLATPWMLSRSLNIATL